VNRAWLLETLKAYLAKLSQDERNRLASELQITPVFNIVFVDSEDGKPKEANRL
jgi:hypothetical protein